MAALIFFTIDLIVENNRHIATDLLHDVRAVQIELFTARVLCRASYRVFEYSTDTGSGY